MTLGSHQQTIGKSQTHITPKWIIDALGPFDLDPCAADPRPWDCALANYTKEQDGLSKAWSPHQFVFLNPPFHRYEVGKWITKLAQHGNGIALLHARTEAAWFIPCWEHAAALFFLSKRITFCKPDGSSHPANSGAPAVLVAFGFRARDKLNSQPIPGVLLERWHIRS